LLLVGGLGGGGDSAGALALALKFRRIGCDVSILGMVPCSVDSLIGAERLAGSLVKISPDTWAAGRFFEPHIARLGWTVYVLCLNESLSMAVEGLEYLKDEGAEAIVSVDFGGDALVRGDEPEVGSVAEDAMGLAIIQRAEKLGFRTLLGVAAVGAEWGGCIPMNLLVENVVKLAGLGAYYGVYLPDKDVRREFLIASERLLKHVPSFMLTVYREALEGRLGERFYRVAYFKGTFRVEKFHSFMYMFDPKAVCSLNFFCSEALRRGRKPSAKLRLKKKGKPRKGIMNWEEALYRLARKKWSPRSILTSCGK